MFPSLFESTTIPVLEQVVGFAQARHGVLASNIANMDTPGYRVRDLSPEKFQARLKQALTAAERRAAAPPGEAGFTAEAAGSRRDSLDEVGKSLEGILYHDQSNDSIEKQVTEMTKNQMQHNLALSIMTSQFRLLQAAISERA
ncbi:MAG: flagellar basal body rod protein FlgB [Pirellulales bacterium]|jgi:flagellar basal-body rod protein FlgB